MKAPYTASDIANYFLFKGQSDQELISNLKLQKRIDYAQGLHLACSGTKLFKEKIKAWAYGPVAPELYTVYQEFGANGIPSNESFDPESIDEETREFLDEIYSVFGQFSAIRLLAAQCFTQQFNGVAVSPVPIHSAS